MATWVIGDIHGCYRTFEALLKKINFSSDDIVVSVGDLINRGPDSALVLERFAYDSQCRFVLGNHDWAYLSWVLSGMRRHDDEFERLATEESHQDYLDLLRKAPFIYEHSQALIVHAGFWPWASFDTQKKWAQQLSLWLQQSTEPEWIEMLEMRGDWQQKLVSIDRPKNSLEWWYALLSVFTNMRYLDPVTQCIDFRFKGYPVFEHQGLKPWFELLNRQMFQDQRQIIFGHWSALTGLFNWPGVIGLDTGCVWGGSLTAYCIETGRLITQENCEIKKSGLMRAD